MRFDESKRQQYSGQLGFHRHTPYNDNRTLALNSSKSSASSSGTVARTHHLSREPSHHEPMMFGNASKIARIVSRETVPILRRSLWFHSFCPSSTLYHLRYAGSILVSKQSIQTQEVNTYTLYTTVRTKSLGLENRSGVSSTNCLL